MYDTAYLIFCVYVCVWNMYKTLYINFAVKSITLLLFSILYN